MLRNNTDLRYHLLYMGTDNPCGNIRLGPLVFSLPCRDIPWSRTQKVRHSKLVCGNVGCEALAQGNIKAQILCPWNLLQHYAPSRATIGMYVYEDNLDDPGK